MTWQDGIIGGVIVAMILTVAVAFGPARAPAAAAAPDYLRAVWHPLHFKPAAGTARDEECLACHREVLEDRVRDVAVGPAWYQRLSTYSGGQETFHRRHLVTPLARRLMDLRCNTCHEGHDPREEATVTLRKQVDAETTCLKCHGRMNWQVMGLPGPWEEVRDRMGNDCLACHATIRTSRHHVSYLDAAAIEAAAKGDADLCWGCHGGRAWYRIAYPYPRHPWPGMPADIPDWAKDRPGYSEARFALPVATINR